MNRVVIKLDEQGNISGVACDQDCRVFVLDKNCKSEPVYELSDIKYVGVRHVREFIGDNLAATIDSDGAWLDTKPEIGVVKP